MRQVKVEALTANAFAPFGQFYTMSDPQGYALCGELHQFFPDRLNADCDHRVGYSPILVKKPERMIITQQEYHTTTWEMILPLDDDMILHVAPASAGTPVGHLSKAFLVPKHTLVKMNTAIWHLAPLPATREQLTAMIILPECTYANDCTVVDLPEEQQFEIVL
jgi:ureidoglycolate lyase